MVKKASVEKYENAKFLFNKFVKSEKQFQPGRDIKLYNQLIKFRPLEFWRDLDLGFKLNSLAFFISEDGRKKVEELELKTEKQKKIEKNRAGIKLVEEIKFDKENLDKNIDSNDTQDINKQDKKVYKNRNSLIDFIGKK